MKIALLLSGGVDSSVALRLLRQEGGYELRAFYLKVWLEDELAHLGRCPWEEDLAYARAVCDAAGVPLEVVPLQRQYHRRVVEDAVSELRAGGTPSPDVLCNRRIKFGAFLDYLEEAHGGTFDRIASGHYARIAGGDGGRELWKGVDPVKDQTYFLFRLDQRQLRRCLFPLGGYHKRQVRRLAERFDLPNRRRKDSQGICFLGQIRYDEFVESYLGTRRGEIREVGSGRRLGEHRGFWFHTVGQRKGLGLGGGPWYVVGKDLEANVVWVAHGGELERHRRHRFRLADVHWIGRPPEPQRRLAVKLRHGPRVIGCELVGGDVGARRAVPVPDLEVRLEAPDPGIAAGQAAVLYDGERCLGGGTITGDRASSRPSPR